MTREEKSDLHLKLHQEYGRFFYRTPTWVCYTETRLGERGKVFFMKCHSINGERVELTEEQFDQQLETNLDEAIVWIKEAIAQSKSGKQKVIDPFTLYTELK